MKILKEHCSLKSDVLKWEEVCASQTTESERLRQLREKRDSWPDSRAAHHAVVAVHRPTPRRQAASEELAEVAVLRDVGDDRLAQVAVEHLGVGAEDGAPQPDRQVKVVQPPPQPRHRPQRQRDIQPHLDDTMQHNSGSHEVNSYMLIVESHLYNGNHCCEQPAFVVWRSLMSYDDLTGHCFLSRRCFS